MVIHISMAALLMALGTASAVSFNVSLAPAYAALKCGATRTPTLTFSGQMPQGTKSHALIFWDQQPNKLTGRWLVFDLPTGTTKLDPVKAVSLQVGAAKAATNEAGQPGYTAICEKGRHDIYIDFYALDVPSLTVPAGTPLQQVHGLIKKHKLAEAKAHLVWVVK